MIKIGFIGAGLIGKERIRAVQILQKQGLALQPVGLVDPFAADAAGLAASLNAPLLPDSKALIAQKPDWVFVATPHDTAVNLLPQLLTAGIKVLVEKPLGRSQAEAGKLAALAAPGHLWVGQNYRFYQGVAALMSDFKAGRFGAPISMSLLIGHGGNPADKDTWKLDPVRAGGGVIIDPGIHLLDLVNMIEGTPPEVTGSTKWSGFWNTGIEEEVHVLLKGIVIPTYDVTISIVRWRSTFRLEIHGTEGYGIVEGRGRSYGAQKYWRGKRWGWQTHPSQAASEELLVETDGADVFVDETRSILSADATDATTHRCTVDEAIANMILIEKIRYSLSLT